MILIPIISSVCIWGAVIVVILRILSNSGISLGGSRLNQVITADKSLKGGFDIGRFDLLKLFGLAMLFRLVIFMISICSIYIMKDSSMSFEDILNTYMQWDAKNYERIALGGYTYYNIDGDYLTLVFFPLYPWLIRLASIFLTNIRVSGILVSWLLYAGACCYLYRLMAVDYNKSTAKRTIVFISAFPHALFFGTMMNESLLLFMSAATLYYIRKHDWVKVGIFGALAALSRMAGLLLAFPAAVEWLEYYGILGKLKEKKIKAVWNLFYSKGLWIFLMLAGLGIYLFCNYKVTGDCFKFFEYEEKYWYQGFTYFGKSLTTMFSYFIKETKYTRFAIWIPAVCSVTFVVAALIYGLRKHRSMYIAYLIVFFIVNAGAKWPISEARYMTCAIPAFMILADFSERHKWTEQVITIGMAVAMGVYLTAYFMQKQIL
ncbi:MAG: glycosyltransferase family 39 protein [Clostridiales bacterium]|nr:glycosyltransferase family 39 protein [Clostridiales bacterium]